MLLKEIKSIFHQELEGLFPKEEISAFFSLLIEEILHLERFVLVLHPQYSLTKEEEQPLFEALSRLKKSEPIQYILGKTAFMDLELKVNPHVLIPRPETEELVQWVIQDFGNQKTEVRILDIGTGSGCIAISLAKNLPNAQVVALDVSQKALDVAKENAQINQVEVRFREENILSSNLEFKREFDLIVSNPPYVRNLEKKQMNKNVTEFEPNSALYVSDDDPLLFYRAIVDFSKNHLVANGKLFFEINQYLAVETKQLLVDNDFKTVELRKDIFGNFRLLKGSKP